jgi:hypothetical protein
MSKDFPEQDWKIFRGLAEVALDRFCARVLAEISAVVADTSKSNHDRYGEIYGLIRNRDRELGQTFDCMSRSKASLQLLLMVRLDLITEEELEQFSDSTRKYVTSLPK